MSSALLVIGGIVQLAFAAFHVLLGISIQQSDTLDAGTRGLLHAMNVFGITAVLFFAYCSLFCRKELVTTRLGRATLVFIALVFLTRAVESPLLFGFEPMICAVCVLAALLYVIPLCLSFRPALRP